jgi:hypothetical protein
VEAGEPTARPSPSNGNTNTYKYHQVPLEGKRFILVVVVAVYGHLLPSAKQFASWRPGEFSTASKLIRIGFVWGVVILIIALALTLTIVLAFVGIALGIIGGILFLIGKVGIIILFFKLRDAFNSTLFSSSSHTGNNRYVHTNTRLHCMDTSTSWKQFNKK